MKDQILWGVLGPGVISHRFARDIVPMQDARMYAVASRNAQRAADFAKQYNVEKVFTSYEDMVNDKDLQAVYVCTPHALHAEHAILAMEHGKAVLVEKPVALSEKQAQRMIDCAKANHTPFMEAMWSRYTPAWRYAKQLVAQGAIGDVRMVIAATGFRTEGEDPNQRLYNPQLGGGALMDMGCYPISFAQYVLGNPQQIVSTMGTPDIAGVDGQNAVVLNYSSGAMAVLMSAFRTYIPEFARILGTKGHIEIPALTGTQLTLYAGTNTTNISEPYPQGKNNFSGEIADMTDMVRTGRLESTINPWADTLGVIRIMDTARAQWGLHYPTDDE